MTDKEFEKIVKMLMKYDENKINHTFNLMLLKLEEVESERLRMNNEIKKMYRQQARVMKESGERLSLIRNQALPQESQKFKEYNDTFIDRLKVESMAKIKKYKAEESRTIRSIEESKIALKRAARSLMEVDRVLLKMKEEVDLLSKSMKVRTFFYSKNVHVETLIEDDIKRFYRIYKNEEGY